MTEAPESTSAASEVTETVSSEEEYTMTSTTAFLPVDEQLSYVRSDLDLIAGLLVAFMVIELCKWSYRFLNIFFPI